MLKLRSVCNLFTGTVLLKDSTLFTLSFSSDYVATVPLSCHVHSLDTVVVVANKDCS